MQQVNKNERIKNGLKPHYNFLVCDITRKNIIVKIDNFYYLYNDIPTIIFDLQFTRNQKTNGSYINFSRKINDLKEIKKWLNTIYM